MTAHEADCVPADAQNRPGVGLAEAAKRLLDLERPWGVSAGGR